MISFSEECIWRVAKNQAYAKEAAAKNGRGSDALARIYQRIAELYRLALATGSVEIFNEAYTLEEGGDAFGLADGIPA